ncbi:hypothetical protein RJ639_038640 [Escallonia herrerae]|uniref:beta-N-acetylhexosaminidase n=1 Tax=Escallonia herrerae TaxID=1293975 RepID=A0AA89B731_9ASTE|nr:hypothetical protein RJ639_038640 [Escallonia herrerae]
MSLLQIISSQPIYLRRSYHGRSNGMVGLMVDLIHYSRLDAGGGDDDEMMRGCGGDPEVVEVMMAVLVLASRAQHDSKRCISVFCTQSSRNSNIKKLDPSQLGVWYLDHIDVPWDSLYNAEPLEGINDASEQELVLGGEVCMWSEVIDASNVQQTIWPRAAAAAERLWSTRGSISSGNTTATALPRLQYFRCLLTRRGVQAAPVTNKYARSVPNGPGSCYEQ